MSPDLAFLGVAHFIGLFSARAFLAVLVVVPSFEGMRIVSVSGALKENFLKRQICQRPRNGRSGKERFRAFPASGSGLFAIFRILGCIGLPVKILRLRTFEPLATQIDQTSPPFLGSPGGDTEYENPLRTKKKKIPIPGWAPKRRKKKSLSGLFFCVSGFEFLFCILYQVLEIAIPHYSNLLCKSGCWKSYESTLGFSILAP